MKFCIRIFDADNACIDEKTISAASKAAATPEAKRFLKATPGGYWYLIEKAWTERAK